MYLFLSLFSGNIRNIGITIIISIWKRNLLNSSGVLLNDVFAAYDFVFTIYVLGKIESMTDYTATDLALEQLGFEVHPFHVDFGHAGIGVPLAADHALTSTVLTGGHHF